MEHLMNKTLDEIKTAYKKFSCDEDNLREMIRLRLSRMLMDTSEDNKLKCEIVLDTHECFGLSSLEMPWITSMWQEPTEGDIVFDIDDGRSVRYFDGLTTEELMLIINNLGE